MQNTAFWCHLKFIYIPDSVYKVCINCPTYTYVWWRKGYFSHKIIIFTQLWISGYVKNFADIYLHLLCNFLQLPMPYYHLGPYIFSFLFPNTLILYYFLGMIDKGPNQYTATYDITLLYIIIYLFLGDRRTRWMIYMVLNIPQMT